VNDDGGLAKGDKTRKVESVLSDALCKNAPISFWYTLELLMTTRSQKQK